jgi:hypothetical protein
MVMGGIEQLAFVDAQHGWLLRSGSDGLGGRGAALYRTSDGGKQWGERFAGRALGSPVAGGWSGFPVTCRDLWIRFIDASNGWASGDCGRGPVSVFLTHDGGELWWQKQLPMGLCSTGCLPELAYLGSNGEIVVTVRYPDTWSGKVFDRPDTILYSSHDEGQSWQARRFPTGRVGPVTFVEAKVGWAMVDGFIYGTHDGGAHWTRLSSTALGVDTAVVDFVDARTGWALGSLSRPAPTLARTAAGGTDWRSLDYVWKPVVGFACRLPFIPQPNDPDRAQAGYIAFPDGQLVNEPSGEFVPQGNLLTSVALPHLSGISGPSFYDRPYSRWLPATAEAVVPDGSSYAYAISTDTGYPSSNRQSELHIVSVASGADHVVSLPGLDPYLAWAVAHYDQRGVYLYQQRWEAEATAERWLLDTSTERLDKVSDAPTLTTAPGWTTDLDPNDPTPVVSGYDGSPLPDRLIKAGNSAVVWFYQPGKFVNLLGTGPDGHPLVVVGTGLSSEDHFELWLVQAPGAAKRIFTGAELLGLQPGVTDSYGLWIGSSEGLYLYEPKGGFRRVARVAGQVAGACY